MILIQLIMIYAVGTLFTIMVYVLDKESGFSALLSVAMSLALINTGAEWVWGLIQALGEKFSWLEYL